MAWQTTSFHSLHHTQCAWDGCKTRLRREASCQTSRCEWLQSVHAWGWSKWSNGGILLIQPKNAQMVKETHESPSWCYHDQCVHFISEVLCPSRNAVGGWSWTAISTEENFIPPRFRLRLLWEAGRSSSERVWWPVYPTQRARTFPRDQSFSKT